jgi:hypothetical protein
MWTVIGIYSGLEDNSFYHRSENGLVPHGVKTLTFKETIPLVFGAVFVFGAVPGYLNNLSINRPDRIIR